MNINRGARNYNIECYSAQSFAKPDAQGTQFIYYTYLAQYPCVGTQYRYIYYMYVYRMYIDISKVTT